MQFLNCLNIDDMYLTMLSIAFILCLYGTSADNTTDYIHQLELKISDLESHSLASEQKQTAVLSSILYRMQSQDQKIQSQEQKIQSQDKKMQSQELVVQELKTELENATKTDSNSVSSSGLHPVVFEVRTSHDLTAGARIRFNKIGINVGSAYSANTGVFKAPQNGTFLIWFSVSLYLSNFQRAAVLKVTGGSRATEYGSYTAATQITTNQQIQESKVLQGVLAVSLVKGNQVYLTLSPPTKVSSASNFGGVFLGDM